MTLDRQIGHLEALDAALTTLTAECSVLSLSSDATEAIATLTRAAAHAKVVLVERILVCLDSNRDAEALIAGKAMLANIYGADLATAAELRRQGKLQ